MVLDNESKSSSKSSVKRVFTSSYVYPDWFTDTDYKFYDKMLSELNKKRHFHTKASEHFNKMNYYIFGPSIAITAISGIASFLSTSSLVQTEVQNGFGISVGIMASISTMLQSIGSSCRFSAKADAHRLASEEYSKLITRLKFEMERPDEQSFLGDMEAQMLEIQNKCNYFVPQFIIDDYYKNKKCQEKKKKRLTVIKPNESSNSTHTSNLSVPANNSNNPNDSYGTFKKVNNEVIINIDDVDKLKETSSTDENILPPAIEENEENEADNNHFEDAENDVISCSLDGN